MVTQQQNVPALRFPKFSGAWTEKQLGAIGAIKTGPFGSLLHEKDYVDKGTPIITVEHLGELGIKHRNLPLVSEKDKERLKGYILKVDDIVFSRVGSVDRNSIIKPEEDGWLFSGRLLRIRTESRHAHAKFLSFSFQQVHTKYKIRSVAVGQTMPSLNTNIIRFFCVFFPSSILEQQKIASFLSSVDTKIEQLGKKKALLEQYKKGMMQKLFSQEIRFKDQQGNDFSDWEGNTLAMLFEISAGGDIENSHSRKNKDGIFRYPIYANSEKAKGLHGYSDRYRVEQNCITVSGRGTLGVAHARFEKFYPIVRLLVLIPRKDINLIFFEHAINLLQIFNESTGVPQLTTPQLKKYHLIYPSINEQRKIADFLSSIHKKIELVAEQLEQARTFKKGLLQKMFI